MAKDIQKLLKEKESREQEFAAEVDGVKEEHARELAGLGEMITKLQEVNDRFQKELGDRGQETAKMEGKLHMMEMRLAQIDQVKD